MYPFNLNFNKTQNKYKGSPLPKGSPIKMKFNENLNSSNKRTNEDNTYDMTQSNKKQIIYKFDDSNIELDKQQLIWKKTIKKFNIKKSKISSGQKH